MTGHLHLTLYDPEKTPGAVTRSQHLLNVLRGLRLICETAVTTPGSLSHVHITQLIFITQGTIFSPLKTYRICSAFNCFNNKHRLQAGHLHSEWLERSSTPRTSGTCSAQPARCGLIFQENLTGDAGGKEPLCGLHSRTMFSAGVPILARLGALRGPPPGGKRA